MTQHRAVARKDILWPNDFGESRYRDLEVVPLIDASGKTLGAQLSFADVSRYRRLQEELERSKNELETVYEELQSSWWTRSSRCSQLRQPIRAVLSGETERAELTLDCRNRGGRAVRCPIRCTLLSGANGETLGAILLMEEISLPIS